MTVTLKLNSIETILNCSLP